MNKELTIWMGLCIILILIVSYNISYQYGTSRDIIQGYDKGILWYHAYLRNDHTTAYCFNDINFIKILEQSQKEQKDVIITYEKYIGKGFLCSTSDKFENVIIKNVEFAG